MDENQDFSDFTLSASDTDMIVKALKESLLRLKSEKSGIISLSFGWLGEVDNLRQMKKENKAAIRKVETLLGKFNATPDTSSRT